ncbi:hypothetical protein BDZ89DRAFT_1233284 [Hymenopellis radicata]|nr:hypothetical protein BDZ89DRAFT_1233284 [Hymenopellis radicata]
MSHSKQSLLLGLDEKLTEFSPSQSILPVTITDVQPVASYSWIEASTPRRLDWDEVYPQLYLSQTAYLFLANHTKGAFSPVVKYSLESIRGRHESQAQDAMGKLDAVLSQIQEEVQKVGKGVDRLVQSKEGAWERS